jgi:DNA-binding NarL/FixJ family response regulator
MGIRNVESAALSQNPKKQIEDARSDILLLDSVGATRPMPQLVKQINCELPELQVILIGMEADVQTFIRCVEAGIAAYMLNDASGRDLAQAVLAVANGLAVCPPDLCLGLFRYFARHNSRIPGPSTHPRLSNRERQLIHQIRSGSTNKEIAAELNLSEQTVKNHVHRILRKLGAPDRLAAAEICYGQV